MTKRARIILFSLLAVLFFFTAPLVILYSQGYRFDFRTKKIVQTGGLYFKVSQPNSQVYLEGSFKKRVDFFFGSSFVDNLVPGNYEVEIKKDGYHSWKKNLEVKEKQVTEAKNIVLLPKEINFSQFSQNVENFYFSPDVKKIILRELTLSGSKTIGWTLKLYNLEGNIKSHLLESKTLAKDKGGVEFLGISWSPDSKRILLKVIVEKQIKYFVLEIEKTPAVLTSLEFLGKPADIGQLSFNPYDQKKIFFKKRVNPVRLPSALSNGVKKEGGDSFELFEANYQTKEITALGIKNFITYEVSGGNIFWLSEYSTPGQNPETENKGFLFKSDLAGKNQQQITENPINLKKDSVYQVYSEFYPKLLFRQDTSLYLFEPDIKALKKISDSAGNLEFSFNAKKATFYNDYEIFVLFLEQQDEQPQKKAGERVFLARFPEKIDEVFWLTNHYLILKAGSIVKVAEIDDRNKLNIVDLIDAVRFANKGETPKIFFNKYNERLYILSGGILYNSESLIR